MAMKDIPAKVGRLDRQPSYARSIFERVQLSHGYRSVGPKQNNILVLTSSAPVGVWEGMFVVFMNSEGLCFIARPLHVRGHTVPIELTLSPFIPFSQEGAGVLIDSPGTYLLYNVHVYEIPQGGISEDSSTCPCNLPSL